MKNKNENVQFRILYFIGIIMIVATHSLNTRLFPFTNFFPLHTFQVALFVFCSGYFFVKNIDKNIWEVIKKKTKKLIIPLYLWNLFYGIIILILHHFGFEFGESFNLNSLFLLPIYNGHQFMLNLASWFIWPLFITEIIHIFIIKLFKKKDWLFLLYFFISLLLGFLGAQLAIKGYNKDWFLLLTRTLYYFPFFSFGMLYHKILEKKDTSNHLSYFGVLFTVTLITIYMFKSSSTIVVSWCTNFEYFYRPYLLGFLGIAFWLRISKILVPSLKNSKIVSIISKNTYSIMMHHIMGFFVLNSMIFLLSSKFTIFSEFNSRNYISNASYIYSPIGFGQFNIIYLVFGILFSIFITIISKKIVSFIKSKINI